MNTEKKNQHYIPKFYLRNFSFLENKKQIGVYNIYNEVFIQAAKLKTQGAKNFFYGYDGVIEDELSNLEGFFSSVIKQIIANKKLPNKYSEDHISLLAFITLTDLRNPVKVNRMKDMFIGVKDSLLELDSNIDLDNYVPQFTHEDIIQILLSQSPELIKNITDLDFKLIINKTNKPFVTSDFPIVIYNQFLEAVKWQHSKSGYGTVGLQIFIPLNHELTLIFYDSGIYKVGNRKNRYLEIINEIDVDSINILQYINCLKTIFFDEKVKEHYIRQLAVSSKKYIRANKNTTELSYAIKDGDNKKEVLKGKKNLIVVGSTDCECKLKINGIKIHSKGRSYKFVDSIAQSRPHCKKVN